MSDDSHLDGLHPDLRAQIINLRPLPKRRFGYGGLVIVGIVLFVAAILVGLQ